MGPKQLPMQQIGHTSARQCSALLYPLYRTCACLCPSRTSLVLLFLSCLSRSLASTCNACNACRLSTVNWLVYLSVLSLHYYYLVILSNQRLIVNSHLHADSAIRSVLEGYDLRVRVFIILAFCWGSFILCAGGSLLLVLTPSLVSHG